jgi:hypothetical protein
MLEVNDTRILGVLWIAVAAHTHGKIQFHAAEVAAGTRSAMNLEVLESGAVSN